MSFCGYCGCGIANARCGHCQKIKLSFQRAIDDLNAALAETCKPSFANRAITRSIKRLQAEIEKIDEAREGRRMMGL